MVGSTRNDYDCADYYDYDDCSAYDYDHDKFDCADHYFDCADYYDYDHDKFDCADYYFDCADYYYICCGPCVGWVCWLFGWQVLGWF